MFVKFPWIGTRGWQYIASIATVSKASILERSKVIFAEWLKLLRGHTMQAILPVERKEPNSDHSLVYTMDC